MIRAHVVLCLDFVSLSLCCSCGTNVYLRHLTCSVRMGNVCPFLSFIELCKYEGTCFHLCHLSRSVLLKELVFVSTV